VPSNLRDARFVLDREGDRVVGIVVAASDASSSPAKDVPSEGSGACTRPAVPDDAPRARSRFGACLSGVGEIVTLDGDALEIRGVDSEKSFVSARIPGAVFAAPIRNEGRDEIAVIWRTDENEARTWFLSVFRFDAGRVTKVIEKDLYKLTAASARWIGAELRDLDLYLELSSRADSIEVAGLLTTRGGPSGDRLRDLIVISPVQVPRRHPKSASTEAPAEPAGSNSDPDSTSRSHP
jgi:hypothetical protein